MERQATERTDVIRQATQDDAPAIARILAQCPEAAQWSLASIISNIAGSAVSTPETTAPVVTEIFMATSAQDNDPAGFVAVRIVPPEMEILNFAVVPANRRRGIARELLAAAFSRARSVGVHRAFLEVRESNAVARAFYSHAGFTDVGRRHGYYRDPPEDAIILSVALD